MVKDGNYIPENDILETLADGRTILLASKGVPIPLHLAEARGFIKDGEPVGPSEVKAVEPDEETILAVGSHALKARKPIK
jgi:hypothetical protein